MPEFRHLSVMPDEVVRFLAPKPGGTYLDGTLGGGGHASLIAERCIPGNGLLIGIDQDKEALRAAGERLARFGSGVRLVHGNFSVLDLHLDNLAIVALDGFILDLGVS